MRVDYKSGPQGGGAILFVGCCQPLLGLTARPGRELDVHLLALLLLLAPLLTNRLPGRWTSLHRGGGAVGRRPWDQVSNEES